MGKQRLGVNLVSLIATLREEGRLPIRSIQWYLRTVHQLRLSVGAIVAATQRTAEKARPAVAGILERIRGSPVVHADETGWRENGANGYVWTFSTPTDVATECFQSSSPPLRKVPACGYPAGPNAHNGRAYQPEGGRGKHRRPSCSFSSSPAATAASEASTPCGA